MKAPVESPLHRMLIWLAIELASTAGCVTVIEVLCVQPPASVIVTVYTPGHWFVKLAVLAPVLQRYVYGLVPPAAVAVKAASQTPLQLTGWPLYKVSKAMDTIG